MNTLPHEKQIAEYEKTINLLKEEKDDKSLLSEKDILKLETNLEILKKNIYSKLTPWERITICRHPQRPRTLGIIENICDSFTELFGDRYFGNDNAVVGGLARIGGLKCILIGNEKGFDTESRVHRNFGMPNPEGFRKALRLMRLAEKFGLPVVSLIDTPGAYPGLAAEERGQAWAIAENLREMVRLTTPIIVLVVGEGCSGGALGTAVGDVIGILEHAYFSVISPEGCASILWKDAGKSTAAATALKLNSENLMDLGIVDEVVKEPLGGAHKDPKEMCSRIKSFILKRWEVLKELSPEVLLEQRYQKFRKMGNLALMEKQEA
ncbi:MAG: acetyl-CoA carboxylase carboxyl transferase subunit alpha [Chlamydiales bacterium]